MLSSLFSGISGLMANSQAISVIGNNIANVNTIGYKGARTTFGDVLYQSIYGAAGTSQVGRGTALMSIDTQFAQGSFESTSESTDLAIGGKGFFIVRSPDSQQNYYTRAGQFRFDKEGNLTTPSGYMLQGKKINRASGEPEKVPVDIVISQDFSEPKATQEIGMVVNLQSDADWTGVLPADLGTGALSILQVGDGKYPVAGYYKNVNFTRKAAADITHTGTDAYAAAAGSLVISDGANEATVALLATDDLAGAVTKINAALTAAGVKVTAAPDGGGTNLVLTASAQSVDIGVDTAGITAGTIGWSASDLASTDLLGATLSFSVDQVLNGSVVDTISYGPASVSALGGTLTDWLNCGLNLTYNALTADTSQNFTIGGFSMSATSPSESAAATSNYSSAVTVYDSAGAPHVVTVYFRKSNQDSSGNNVWEYHAYIDKNDAGITDDKVTGVDVQAGYLTFNQRGVLIDGFLPQSISFDFAGAESNQAIEFNFGSGSGGGASTQYPIASTTNFQSQDGYPPGKLTNVSVSQEGIISGHYSNGQILALYEITLANFNNAQGLSREGQNLFSETLESGVPYTNAPGEGSLGKINPNSLEQSNVDLAAEFVKMIITQRGFQANARIITTTDEMLAEMMNIKR